jgi:hypothetical protein
MGTEKEKPQREYEVEIGCLSKSHREIVYFKIRRGEKSAKCPVCGKRASR